MNMFAKVLATSIQSYLKQLPEDRRHAIEYLHDWIPTLADNLAPHFATNMLGYGSFPYTNYKRESIEWPIVALANRKQYISLYICAVEDGEYLPEKYQADLGKVKVGKSCINLKKLEYLNLATLKEVIVKAARNPGLSPSTH